MSDKQFKITAYPSERDYKFKRDHVEFTDIETLLRFLGTNSYWRYGDENVEVTANDDFTNLYRDKFEGGSTDKIVVWEINERPTDTKMRIVGVSCLAALPQRLDKFVFKNVDDLLSTGLNVAHTSFYPMTIDEFLKRLAGAPAYEPNYGHQPPTCDELDWEDYDFVALETID